MIGRRAGAVVLSAVLAAVMITGCTAGASGGTGPSPAPSADAAQHGPAIRVVSPAGAVHLGEEVDLVIRATVDGAPLAGRDVTFEVVSGPAAYPGGFETSVSDADGVASSLRLRAAETGRVTIRVAVGEVHRDLTIDVTGS